MSFLFRFNKYIIVSVLSEWLNSSDVVKLSFAIYSEHEKNFFKNWLREYSANFSSNLFPSDSKLPLQVFKWAVENGLHCRSTCCVSDITNLNVLENTITRLIINDSVALNEEDYECELFVLSTLTELSIENGTTAGLLNHISSNNFSGSLLRTCHLEYTCPVYNSQVRGICYNCPSLTDLKISSSAYLGSNSLLSIAVYLRKLEHLELTGQWFEQQQLNAFILHCKAPLRTLITEEDFHTIGLQFLGAKLEKLRIPYATQIRNIRQLGSWCPNLTDLSIINWYVDDVKFGEVISKLTKLKHLKFELDNIMEEEDMQQVFAACTRIVSFKATILMRVNEPTVQLLSCLIDLQVLNVESCPLKDDDMIKISKCCRFLRDVNVSNNSYLTHVAFISLLQNCQSLNILTVNDTLFEDESMEAIVLYGRRLKVLSICSCSVTLNSIVNVVRFSPIEKICITANNYSSAELKDLVDIAGSIIY